MATRTQAVTMAQPVTAVPAVRPPAAVPVVPPRVLQPANYLAWDAVSKETNALPGATNVNFTFWLTNVSPEEVLVNGVTSSCGCTVAQLPTHPWRVAPGTNGPIKVTVDVRNRPGTMVKSVTVDSSAGLKTLLVKVTVPPPPQTAPVPSFKVERIRNMQIAMGDRQAVLKGQCAKCHVEPGNGKLGKELYVAMCGICHEAERRAPLVPDLKALPHPAGAEHWRKWIIAGRPGSMMPGFAQAAGGPLGNEQIASLVEYLSQAIAGKPLAAPATPPAAGTSPAGSPGASSGAFVVPKGQ